MAEPEQIQFRPDGTWYYLDGRDPPVDVMPGHAVNPVDPPDDFQDCDCGQHQEPEPLIESLRKGSLYVNPEDAEWIGSEEFYLFGERVRLNGLRIEVVEKADK